MKRRGGAKAIVAAIVVLMVVGLAGFLLIGNGFGMKSQISGGLSSFEKGLGLLESATANVQVTGLTMISDTFDGSSPLAPTCASTPLNSYIALTNSGSSSSNVASVTISYGGADNMFRVAGTCAVGPSGSPTSTVYLLFPGPSQLPNSSAPTASEPFLGNVNLSNGAHIPFSGDFQQGYPKPFVAQSSFTASEIAIGRPNATCQYSLPAGVSYLEVSNSGTEDAAVAQVTVGWNGTSSTVLTGGSCELGPNGSQSASVFVVLTGVDSTGHTPTAGQEYSLSVLLTNGAAAPLTAQYTGTFA